MFQALADPTRRAIVERLSGGSASVSELAEPFDVTLSAIGQHIRLLEELGIVRSNKVGRTRTVELAPAALTAAERWFTKHRARWEQRFDRLGQLLAEDDDTTTEPKQPRKKS